MGLEISLRKRIGGVCASRQASLHQRAVSAPVARSSAQAANYIPAQQNAAQRPAGACLRGYSKRGEICFVTRHTREFLDTTTRAGFMTR